MNRPVENIAGSAMTENYSSQMAIDECFNGNEGLRENWKRLLANMEALGPSELKERQLELAKLLQENGVTYNVYGDTDGLNRPWQLDAVPLLVSNWETIERGMKQRAFVLNKLLEDLYGEQILLKKKIIPPELIHAHQGFLRPCVGVKLPGSHQLVLYSADLSRGPDGRIWVIKDRAQAPSGMGYALENRSALSRVLPELFSHHQVAKLGEFFNSMMQALTQIAPNGKEQPRIVLLTPGPRNETYFEHAYLASALGLTLVQGEDLIMRDSTVYIKTVDGLEKVDVILRRVDDTYCDPLELREESQLGIPGLLQAVRKGNVSIANPLGSSILENTGLKAFLAGVFRYYGEDPILPIIATWWCGQKKEMEHVIANIDKLVIKTIDRASGFKSVMGSHLSSTQRAELIARIRFEPYLFCGQEEVEFSTSPVFNQGKLEPRFMVLRSYLAASKDGYKIMRGGLTRCSPVKGSFLVSNQKGGLAKDTWVEGPQEKIPTHSRRTFDAKRKAVLPSRTAENVFWAGRYTQRLVRSTRFVRLVLKNLTQSGYLNNENESESMRVMLQTITHLTGTYPGFVEDAEAELRNPLPELHQVICNRELPGSILFTLNNMLRSMYSARDRWTVDSWRIIDDLEGVRRKMAELEPGGIRTVFSLLDQLNIGLLSFSEMGRQCMYRTQSRTMFLLGQVLEEILMELTLHKSMLSYEKEEGVEFQLLETLLLACQNLSTYRSVYRISFDVAPAVDLLFFNNLNPTSLIAQFEGLLKYVKRLPAKEGEANDSELSRLAFECYSRVRLTNISKVIEADPETGHRKGLEEFCTGLENQVSLLFTKLSANYFIHSTYQAQGDKGEFQVEV